jgi:hypothetical protein
MDPWTLIAQLWTNVREFIVPSYRPELHYMRGPGPAYARVHARSTRSAGRA